MKKIVLLMIITMMSTFSFANNKLTVEQSVINLENRLRQLAEKEEEQVNMRAVLVAEAEKKLSAYVELNRLLDARIIDIEENINRVIYIKEFKDKLAEYKLLKAEVAKEIARETKTIEEFNIMNLKK